MNEIELFLTSFIRRYNPEILFRYAPLSQSGSHLTTHAGLVNGRSGVLHDGDLVTMLQSREGRGENTHVQGYACEVDLRDVASLEFLV